MLVENVFAQTLVSSESRHASVGQAGFVGELSTPSTRNGGICNLHDASDPFYMFVQRFVVAGMTAGSVRADPSSAAPAPCGRRLPRPGYRS